MRTEHPNADAVVQLRQLDPSELVWSASLHEAGLASGLFPSLGRGFLARYHECFVSSPFGVALVADVDGRPAGFVVGWVDGPGHAAWVARRRARGLAIAGAVALASRPHLWVGFARTRAPRYARGLFRLLRRPANVAVRPTSAAAILSHIVVEVDARGAGLGTRLLHAFEAEIERRGAPRAELRTTDATDFYVARSWRQVGAATDLDGVEQIVLARDLQRAGSHRLSSPNGRGTYVDATSAPAGDALRLDGSPGAGGPGAPRW